MKKIFILNLLLFASIVSFGQIIKTKTIFNANLGNEKILALISGDNIEFQFIATDARFTKITRFIDVVKGSASDVCYFLNTAVKFMKENESGTTTFINGQMLKIYTSFGIKGVYVFENSGGGYHSFTQTKLNDAIDKLAKFCLEQNIEFTCNVAPVQETETQKTSTPENSDKYLKLRELKKLLDEGIITQDEFNKEKSKILEN